MDSNEVLESLGSLMAGYLQGQYSVHESEQGRTSESKRLLIHSNVIYVKWEKPARNWATWQACRRQILVARIGGVHR